MKPTIEGANYLLNVGLRGQSAEAAWYIGLFEGDYTPTGSDTAAGIVAAATECTSYSQSTRPSAGFAAPSGGASDNAAGLAAFTFTADKTIHGAFLISSQGKGSGSGKLMTVVRFPTARTVQTGETMSLYAASIFNLASE